MRIAIVLALGAVTAAISAESLALGAALEASDSANPVLAASALRLNADRVAFDRAAAAAQALVQGATRVARGEAFGWLQHASMLPVLRSLSLHTLTGREMP